VAELRYVGSWARLSAVAGLHPLRHRAARLPRRPGAAAHGEGHIARLEAPGLGIEVDEEAVRRADRTGHAWRNPVWRQDDGSFAEW
jgi:hypothetical protein